MSSELIKVTWIRDNKTRDNKYYEVGSKGDFQNVRCPGCKYVISKYAAVCPGCGRPGPGSDWVKSKKNIALVVRSASLDKGGYCLDLTMTWPDPFGDEFISRFGAYFYHEPQNSKDYLIEITIPSNGNVYVGHLRFSPFEEDAYFYRYEGNEESCTVSSSGTYEIVPRVIQTGGPFSKKINRVFTIEQK